MSSAEKYEIRRGEFGWALEEMKRGRRVARAGWNGKGMWIRFIGYAGTSAKFAGDHGTYHWQDFIAMKTVQDTMVPWLCSQTDLLAEDWEHADAHKD